MPGRSQRILATRAQQQDNERSLKGKLTKDDLRRITENNDVTGPTVAQSVKRTKKGYK